MFSYCTCKLRVTQKLHVACMHDDVCNADNKKLKRFSPSGLSWIIFMTNQLVVIWVPNQTQVPIPILVKKLKWRSVNLRAKQMAWMRSQTKIWLFEIKFRNIVKFNFRNMLYKKKILTYLICVNTKIYVWKYPENKKFYKCINNISFQIIFWTLFCTIKLIINLIINNCITFLGHFCWNFLILWSYCMLIKAVHISQSILLIVNKTRYFQIIYVLFNFQ